MRFAFILFSALFLSLFPLAAAALHDNSNGFSNLSPFSLTDFSKLGQLVTRFAPIFPAIFIPQAGPQVITVFATLYFADVVSPAASCSPACGGVTPYCISGNRCVQCTQNAQCASGNCDLSTYKCTAAPAEQQAVIGPAPSCSPACSGSTPYCYNNQCVQCYKNTQCASGQCNLTSFQCICTADPQCAEGQSCINGACRYVFTPVPGGCASDADCSQGEVCNVDSGQCEAQPPADPAPGEELLPGEEPPLDELPPEEQFDPSLQGCTADSDCAPGEICDASGQCLPQEQQPIDQNLGGPEPTLEEPTAQQTQELVQQSRNRCPSGQVFVDNACYATSALVRCGDEIHPRANGVCCSRIWFNGETRCPREAGGSLGNIGGGNLLIFILLGAIIVIAILFAFALSAFKPPSKPPEGKSPQPQQPPQQPPNSP